MDGYPRGISRSIVCVTSISGTCHHMEPGQEASGPTSSTPNWFWGWTRSEKISIMCKSPLWGMPRLRLYRRAPSCNCHYPHKSRGLHTSQIQPRDEGNREECHNGKMGIKKGKWRERWRRRSQIFFLLFTSLNNKKVNAFRSPKLYLCLPDSWRLIAAAGGAALICSAFQWPSCR